jgi:hypothetical protein
VITLLYRLLLLVCLLPLAGVGCASTSPASPVHAAAVQRPEPPAPLPPGPAGIRARLLVGAGDANWVDVFVAGTGGAAQARCREALTWVGADWRRNGLETSVTRDCSSRELPALLAVAGEPLVLVAPQDPSMALSLRRMVSGQAASTEDAPATVVTRHTHFQRADECAQMLAKLKARHDEGERSAAESAREWLGSERTQAVERRDQECESARQAAATCKAKKSKLDANLSEIEASRLERSCESSTRIVQMIEKRLAQPPAPPAPFEARCAPASP